MASSKLKIYIRANQLTDEVQARFFETGGSFTQHGNMGEGEHALVVWELANYDQKAWEAVAKWMGEIGVDFNAEVVVDKKK